MFSGVKYVGKDIFISNVWLKLSELWDQNFLADAQMSSIGKNVTLREEG